MKKIIFCISLCMGFLCASAQNQQSWESLLHDMGIFDDTEQEMQASTFEVLNELAEHKVNLHSATQEDLEQIPFLSDEQIEEICEYQYRYGPMRSIGELALIESLSYEQRKLLSFFVEIRDTSPKGFPSMKDILKYGKNELMGNIHIPFYEREGNKDVYLGYPYKHSFRYSFQYGEYVKAGIIGAQDAGEPFLSNKNKWGYDYYSFYVQLRKIGKLKSLVLGRYRLNLGMGLVINNDFGLGKIATLVSLGQSPNQIRPHSSRTEGNYLQGIATSIRLSNHVDLASFISYRHVDATLNADSTIASIVETGYHRTISEMNKKHNATEGLIGSHINYRNKSFRIGMTGIYHAFNKEINPKTSQIYRQFYPSGKHFWNISTDYGIKTKHLNLHGETATGGCKALATINSLSWQPSNNMTFIAVQRFYSYKYHAIHSQSFSEGGSVQDESGIYVGIDWQPNQRLQLKYYSDFAYFAWPKYQADAPSHAWDHFLSATYQHGSSSFSARYRMKMRERNNEDKTSLSYQYEHRGRFSFTQTYHAWTVKSQIDLALTRQTTNSFGWMISQNITYRHRQSNINVSIAYFHTDDYNSRIYSYEKQPLYSFSFPMYYGQGIRYSLFFRQDIHSHWMIIAKVGVTNYFDRNSIGTGLQTIHHSSQADLDLQFRWKF